MNNEISEPNGHIEIKEYYFNSLATSTARIPTHWDIRHILTLNAIFTIIPFSDDFENITNRFYGSKHVFVIWPTIFREFLTMKSHGLEDSVMVDRGGLGTRSGGRERVPGRGQKGVVAELESLVWSISARTVSATTQSL